MLTTFQTYLEKPKANEVWISSDGIEYTVISNKAVKRQTGTGIGGRGWEQYGNWVKAVTFDLSIEDANGTLDGKKCHWVNEMSDDFAEKFTKK